MSFGETSIKKSKNIMYDEDRSITANGSQNFNYKIEFEKDIFAIANTKLKDILNGRKLLVIVSDYIFSTYGEAISEYFNNYFQSELFKVISLKDTDENKGFQTIVNICKEAVEFGLDRRGVIVAIGGGILMDIAGLAASVYRRKIDYVRIPTTLLGQIDAGIGIKTAVNVGSYKNLIGSFHPPMHVINDISFLNTLGKNEILAGLSEILKMAIVCDKHLFREIELSYEKFISMGSDDNVVENICYRAIHLMIEELQKNYYEKELERLVDFGHTFSPFFEEASNYSITHGLAVALDMALSTEISYLKGYITKADRDRILAIYKATEISFVNECCFNSKRLYKSLNKIVAHRGNSLNLVVPSSIGKGRFIKSLDEISEELLNEAFKNLVAEKNIQYKDLAV